MKMKMTKKNLILKRQKWRSDKNRKLILVNTLHYVIYGVILNKERLFFKKNFIFSKLFLTKYILSIFIKFYFLSFVNSNSVNYNENIYKKFLNKTSEKENLIFNKTDYLKHININYVTHPFINSDDINIISDLTLENSDNSHQYAHFYEYVNTYNFNKK